MPCCVSTRMDYIMQCAIYVDLDDDDDEKLKSEVWKLKHEIWNMKYGIGVLTSEIWNMKSEIWRLKYETKFLS